MNLAERVKAELEGSDHFSETEIAVEDPNGLLRITLRYPRLREPSDPGTWMDEEITKVVQVLEFADADRHDARFEMRPPRKTDPPSTPGFEGPSVPAIRFDINAALLDDPEEGNAR